MNKAKRIFSFLAIICVCAISCVGLTGCDDEQIAEVAQEISNDVVVEYLSESVARGIQ